MGLKFTKKLPATQQQSEPQQYDQNYVKTKNYYNNNSHSHTTKHIVDDAEYSDEDPEIMFIKQKPISTSSPRDMFSSDQQRKLQHHMLSDTDTLSSMAQQPQQHHHPATTKRPMGVQSLLKKSSIGRFNRVPALNPIVKTQQQISPTHSFSMNGFSTTNSYKPPMIGVNGINSIIGHQQNLTGQSSLSLRKNSVKQNFCLVL